MIIIKKFNTTQAATLAGFKTRSMVNYLCREDLIKPTISGSQGRGKLRYFSFKDVLLLKAYNRILKNGVSVKNLKDALKASRDFKSLRADMVTLEGTFGVVNYMFSDGTNIYFRKDQEELINLTKKGQLEFVFILNIGQIHEDLVADIKSKRTLLNLG